ncbi:Uncharacterized protein FWK35_00028783 [Aphis craccivora]|uniref:Uncharacterized protein n=1 Tax=Aphis craccivora TaxID=307492 RepID=A0A6G0W2D4_APHCR|nr:Uncharacterized protein FWK35_00028783 [Aphis craccivora]
MTAYDTDNNRITHDSICNQNHDITYIHDAVCDIKLTKCIFKYFCIKNNYQFILSKFAISNTVPNIEKLTSSLYRRLTLNL